MKKRQTIYLSLMLPFLFLSACETVKPWEKGNLARSEMGFSSDILEKKLGEHIYFSKEASSAGHSVSGGGCGCN